MRTTNIKIVSHVRGGGHGDGAWVARIEGPCERYRLKRAFLARNEFLSASGRSGTITFRIDCPSIYEMRGVQHPKRYATIGELDSGFLVVLPGTRTLSDCLRYDRMRAPEQMMADGLSAHQILSLEAIRCVPV